MSDPSEAATSHSRVDYRCSYCNRPLADLDDTCKCGNAVGVLDL